jgi:hypothetical protein
LKKRNYWICAIAALVAGALAGCGSTTYFAGRSLPPSGLTNRVLIAVQNPSTLSKGALNIVDAYYDIRSGYNGTPASFSIAGFGGSLPVSIQNMPEEQVGAVYGSGDGTFTLVKYGTEKTDGTVTELNGFSSGIFITRNEKFVFAANQAAHVMTVVNRIANTSYKLSLPGIYRVSVNPGGSVAMAFVQNSNYVYYARQLSSSETTAYTGGSSKWPKAAVDCYPQNAPGWCLFQAQSPDALDSTGNYYGAPLVFDHPTKALFSSDGSTAYVLSCGPECGGTQASISLLPTSPLIFTLSQASGLLPCNTSAASCTNTATKPMTQIALTAGSNALISGTKLYVTGQKLMPDNYWGGYLSVIDLTTNALVPSTSSVPNPVSISDGTPGSESRIIKADDDTLWIGMKGCDTGERANTGQAYGCLTMYSTATGKVIQLQPYLGSVTGIAAVTDLHKIYVAQGGQVYIYSTTNGIALDNQYVTVTGTAYDVAYIDATTDTNNTVY